MEGVSIRVLCIRFSRPKNGRTKGIALQERGEYLCKMERGEESRDRRGLICCVGVFVYPQNGHMRITAGLRLRFAVAPSAQLAVWSLRLLKGRSASVVPSLQVRKPAAVRRSCWFGGDCSETIGVKTEINLQLFILIEFHTILGTEYGSHCESWNLTLPTIDVR